MPVFRVKQVATAGGVAVHNVMHVEAGGEASNLLAGDLATAWRANIVPHLSNVYVHQGCEVEDIASDDQGGYATGTGTATGGQPGAVLPSFVCASVRLTTGRRGRAGAGRLGLGPIAEAQTEPSGNVLADFNRNGMQVGVTAFLDAVEGFAGDGFPGLVVVSYFKGVDAQGKPIKRPVPLVTPVTGSAINSVVGTRLSRHPNR